MIGPSHTSHEHSYLCSLQLGDAACFKSKDENLTLLSCLQEDNLRATYGSTREVGLGAEVKRRILMGTYALSAGYYDAYYQRAQKVDQLCLKATLIPHRTSSLIVLRS